MANYLMALLGHTEPGMFGMPENGRMGDYVFNQEGMFEVGTCGYLC
jgi:E3 ubiquitin-protein ligase RNF115/126